MATYGAGVAGLLYGEAKRDEQHSLDLEAMKREMQAANVKLLGNQAAADAAVALVNSLVTEVQAEAEGKLPQRRFSDPAAKKLRTEAFSLAAQNKLKRLSEAAGVNAVYASETLTMLKIHDGEPNTAPPLEVDLFKSRR